MIRIESAHIEEIRGIRKLDIDLHGENFAIFGPNGSGKSGVIDAIEFALTGAMSRLSGRGTKGLSVTEHGPHIDKVKFPDAAFVSLVLSFPSLGKTATIFRKVSTPKKLALVPDDPDIRAAVEEVASHPEVALSRREILRFILVEPSKRSEEIQAILKLEGIGHTRSALNTAQNKLATSEKTTRALSRQAREELRRHLGIASFTAAELLEAVNARRKTLGLGLIKQLLAHTAIDEGMNPEASQSDFNKEGALRDLEALGRTIASLKEVGRDEASQILNHISRLETDAALRRSLQQRSLVEKGLDLVDDELCPLCDKPWDSEGHLREHLQLKLAKSNEAEQLKREVLSAAGGLSASLNKLGTQLSTATKFAQAVGQSDFVAGAKVWMDDLAGLRSQLAHIEQILGLKDRLESGWAHKPDRFNTLLSELTAAVQARPDLSATINAATFLATAQSRLTEYRETQRKLKAIEASAKLGKEAYEAYCTAMDDELEALYNDVQDDFSAYYRAINEDDEGTFTAKLTPSAGRLDFDVNFYERGLFPPGAYHSEGHQDGMGVCLYLALMKRLFGDQFTFALLDDVVMSVDSAHRYQFCRLLKSQFPATQFVITTHDRLWAEQMKSAGVVTSKSLLAFHSWTVETGPLVESHSEIWDEIAANLAKGKVEVAAAALRHHLEYISRHLAGQLGAAPQFRSDGNYELGELLPAVLTRIKSLCGKAAEAAQSWGRTEDREKATTLKSLLSTSAGAMSVEQWAVNRAVHYNEWANFGRKDFEPVVAVFRELLDCFRCEKCQSWLYVTPHRGPPEAVRCSCSATNMNLKPREKS